MYLSPGFSFGSFAVTFSGFSAGGGAGGSAGRSTFAPFSAFSAGGALALVAAFSAAATSGFSGSGGGSGLIGSSAGFVSTGFCGGVSPFFDGGGSTATGVGGGENGGRCRKYAAPTPLAMSSDSANTIHGAFDF